MTEKLYALVQDKNGKKFYVSDNQLKEFKIGDKVSIRPDIAGTTSITAQRSFEMEI
jgi:ribosomal protein L21E